MQDRMTTVDEVLQALAPSATAERRAELKASVSTDLMLLGVTPQAMKPVIRALVRQLKKSPPQVAYPFARDLVDRGILEVRLLAYEMIGRHKPAIQVLDEPQILRLGAGIDNWMTVDAFSSWIAGPSWRSVRLQTPTVHEWAGSEDPWWRRAAVACTVSLNQKARGGRGDARRTLGVCELVVADRHPAVVKALSFALRELAKRDPEPVSAFLETHGDTLASRVRKEVSKRLAAPPVPTD